MNYNLNNKEYYRFSFNTDEANLVNTDKTEFTFRGMLPINLVKDGYIKICSFASNTTGDNVYIVKLKGGVDYNKAKYWSSDFDGDPTLMVRAFNGKSSLNLTNYGLEIPPQVITDITLEIKDSDGYGVTGTNQKMYIDLIIEEMEEK